ncbi:MAG: hypothetical protein ACOZB0_04230 [Pseudomonadota bacterium]
MKHSPLLMCLAAWLVIPAAQADLTLIGRSSLTSLNMPNHGREALYVKGHQLRRDLTSRGRSFSYLYDLKKKQITVIDHFQRQVERLPLDSGKATAKGLKLDLKATGRKHEMQDWICEEQDLAATLPSQLGEEKVTVVLDGQVWLERKTPHRTQVAPFVKAVEADDFFVGAATPGQNASAQAIGINEVMRQILGKGMVCAAEVQLRYEGSGPMADLGRRMATRAGMVFESVADQPLKDEVFMVPAGYQDVRR